uniref:Uncharacterized protein n=1 Tax=Daphnia galeata TaxID=27404 RepID=A0A8J2S9U2_9CRUS|nr:unnamed protein product [Daphnia galeata]
MSSSVRAEFMSRPGRHVNQQPQQHGQHRDKITQNLIRNYERNKNRKLMERNKNALKGVEFDSVH